MFYVAVLFSSRAFCRVTQETEGALHCRGRRPTPALPAAGGAGVRVMAKGQVKSNKEVRKPKAEKPKPAVSVGSSPFTTPPGKK